MEEDIKILEDMIKRLDKDAFDIYRKAPNTEDYLGTITGKEILSVEHLIARNKELEEENKKYTIKLTDEQYRIVIDKAQQDCEKISLDKVDESTMLKQIKNKLEEENIPIETLIAEFDRLEDIEDDRDCNYIPKSKVRELLKEIDEANFDEGWWYEEKIKKLLED